MLPRLQRDRFTYTLYGPFIVWGWFLYAFSPAVPLLAADLGITNAQAGLHGTAMAVGAVIAAATTPRMVRRFGRRPVVVTACLVIVAGVAVLTTGWALPVTLGAVVVIAVGGNMLIAGSLATLADHHGPTSSAALTEANAWGSGVGLVGPLAVGAAVALGWGWRPAVAVTVLLAGLVAVLLRRLPADGALGKGLAAVHARAGGAVVAPAVRTSRWFVVTIVTAVAVENATTYWAADLVRERTGAGAGVATATTAGLVAGMTLARFVIRPLSLRIAPARLLAAAYGVAILGWAVLWTATSTTVALAGLFVAGLGYGAHYPLGIALLLGASGGATDSAQARATVAGGIAVGIAPFVLGALADAAGAHTAFLIVPVVAVAGGIAALAGARAWRAERLPLPVV
jgi:MFS family permease